MASLPTNLCELFAQSVRQYPENLAVEHEDGSFTYKELDDTSSALAHDLKLLRVGRGSLVLLVTTHGSFNIIAILAILKAGGCFVPIDRKTWSPEMINYVCDKVESHIIINTTPEPFSAAKGSHHVLHLTSLPTISSSQISPSVYPQTLEDDDACIIFTSGSTGCPKGVILSHKSLCLYSTTSPMNLDIVPGDRLLHILSVAFDACACMLFSTLGNGGTVVPTQAEDIYAKAPSCTVAAATPSILNTIMDSSSDPNILNHVHTVILGGETAKQDLLRSLLDAGIRVLVGYGATETTSMGSIHVVTRDPKTNAINPLLIGASIKQSPIHLVNSDDQLIEDNFAEGEILIAGDGLSRGYYKDDAKTNSTFIYWNSTRVYKTGDYGRWIPNPEGGRLIEFRGRKDRTVKNGGFLVNLDRDVENALSHVGMSLGVTSVCAAVTEDGIVAVVTPESIDTVALLAKARESMSTYCIPYRIEAVESFPTSSNGKVQHRKVLEVISATNGTTGSNIPVAMPLPPAAQQSDPKTMAEEERLSKIIDVASNIFGLSGDGTKRIQESDSFLKLGGSSLLAFKLASALRQRNLNISPKDLFSGHTFQEIAKYSTSINIDIAEEGSFPSPADEKFGVTQKLASLRSQARSILALENDSFDIGPLTSLQLTLALPTLSCSWKSVNQVKLSYGSEYASMIERAWRAVWQAEPVFRTELCLTIGCGAQIVHKRSMRKPKLQLFNNSSDYEEAVQKADTNVGLGCSLEFILYHPIAIPGATAAVSMPKEIEELTIVLTAHHSLMDGLSLQILLANVEHAARGRQIPRSLSSIEAYLELISIQQKKDASARNFFSEYLRKVRLADNLPKKPDIAIGGNMSLNSPNNSILFGPSVKSDEVAHFATQNGVSPACVYYTAWAMAMSTFENNSTIVMGSVFSNRASHPEFHNVIGLYMSTLPLVVSIDANETVYQLLHRTMGDILSLGEYAWARSDQVGIGSHMNSLVALQPPLPDENSHPPAIRAESVENSEFPLSLLIESNGEFRILHNSGVFDEGAIRRLGGHFKQALRGVLNHTLVGECMRLSALQETVYRKAEKVRIGQSEQTVKRALEDSIDRFQDYIAIEDCKGNTLTYRQLEQQTNIIAKMINEHLSDTTATSVAIYGDGSVGWLLGLLGILKTSRTFVPLDPKWSMERKAMVLEASKAAAIVVPSSAQQNEVPMIGAKKALTIDHMLSVDERAARLPDTGHADSVLVYIFTSGTTGAPKGIPTTHRSFLAFQSNPEATMFAAPGRRIAQFMSPAFDACNEEIFSALLHGATLVLRDPLDPYAHLLKVNTVTMTPAVLSVLEPEHYPNLEIIYATGEAITAPIVEKFATKKLLYNAYGPAECSISTSFERMIQGDVITIGKASATARMYLLDERQNPVPKGVQGEIYLAGVQVLERYINAPEQTALRVLPDPWHPKERMYRTGDYGICVKDGRVIYMGRIDRQVKIRGFRIELDGVEHAILSEPAIDDISQCAVLAIDGLLVAYITFGSKNSQTPTQERIDRLRNRMLETQLPSWVPQQIVPITDFPKSVNGKVDNKALEQMYRSKSFHHDETVPGPSISTDVDGVESKLSEAWCEILQLIPPVRLSPEDNFFSLGGHSVLVLLLATKLTGIFAVEITTRELLPSPVFQDQVNAIKHLLETKRGSEGHTKEPIRSHALPIGKLTELEKQVWFQYQVGTTVTAFNIANILTVNGQIDYTRLVNSVNTALVSDPVLSCNFVEGPDGLRRVIRSSAPQVREVEQLDIASEINYAFDLEHDELIRVHIIRQPEELGGTEKTSMTEIVITTSHSIADLATLQNLLRLVSTAYAGKVIKAHKEPQHLSSSHWQYTPTMLEQSFWREYLRKDDAESSKLSHFKVPLLPSVTAAFHGTSRVCEFRGNLITRLNALIERLGITHHHMALTVAALLLQWLMKEDDIVLGAPNANRCTSIEREALGQFLDRLPIRILLDCPRSTSGGASLTQILTNVRDSAIKALTNAIPFSKILEALNISSGGLQHPIFDCMVTFHLRNNSLDKWLQLPDCDVTVSPRFAEGAKFPLMLEWFELDADYWSLHIEHDTNRLPNAIIDTIEHVLEAILEAIADECLLLDLHTRLADATEASSSSMDHNGTSVSNGGPPRVPGLGLLLPFSEVINMIQREMKLCLDKGDVQILPDTSFFSVGADSNAAIALRHRLQALELEVPLRAIFTAKSPMEIARHVTV